MKRIILLLLGVIFALGAAASAWGASVPTYTLSPSDFEPDEDDETEYYYTLAEILDAANGEEYSEIIINLISDYNMSDEGEGDECLVIDEDEYDPLKTITITGGYKLIAASGSRHFTINDPGTTLNFSGITITGSSGGGVEVNAGTFTATNTTFTGNGTTTASGGAVLVAEGASATFTGCTFTGNTASDGGAISNSGTLSLASGTTFTGNSASGNGGALHLTTGSVTLSGVSFGDGTRSGRNSAVNGGAISTASDAVLTLTGCSLNVNSADLGGAIYAEGTVNLSANTITGNTAIDGGAIYLTSTSTLNITGTDTQAFSANTASGNGGAIYAGNEGSDVSAMNFSAPVSFSDNKASGNGGALWVYSGSQLSGITSTASFTANSANYGGAVYVASTSSSTLTLDSSAGWTFSGNTANYDGGAIFTANADVVISDLTLSDTASSNSARAGGFLYCGGGLTITNATISGYRAEYGGAVYAAEGAVISGSTFSGNRASIETQSDGLGGGALYVLGEAVISDSTFTDNRVTTSYADHGGGAIFSSGDITITGSTFSDNNYTNSNNSTEGGGGAIYSHGGLSLTNSQFTTNEVKGPTGGGQGCGGAVYANNSTVDILNCYFSDNVSDFNGGALYLFGNCTTTMRYTTFYMNATSYGNGGAVYGQGVLDMGTYDDRHNMSNVGANYFISNNAVRNGGAVCFNYRLNGQGQLRVSYSMFNNNSTSNGNGGALYIYNDTAAIESCTFDGNSASASSSSAAYGGAVYMDTSESTSSTVTNSTFFDNKAYGTGAWGGALYTSGKISLICSTFTQNEATDRGGAVYVKSGTLSVTANILVGNTSLIGNDVCNEAQITTSGYNRIGIYGSGSASSAQNAMWSLAFNNETDRESSSWTMETFFGANAELAVNATGNDDEPPAIGTTLDTGMDQAWLLTLKLSEDASLALVDRATNVVPYARRLSLGIPRYDENRVDRFASAADITIGANYVYRAWGTNQGEDGDYYPIGSVTLSGIVNLKYPGQSGSLIAIIHYTNGRTAYGVPVTRTSYTKNAEEPVIWYSSLSSAVSVDVYGNVTALGGTGSAGAIITVETVRMMSDNTPATATMRIVINADDFSGTYNYLNMSSGYMRQLYGYYEALHQFDYDLSFYLADVSDSAVNASSFQNNFASAWTVKPVQITDLTSSAPTFTTAASYAGNSGLVSSKKGAVSINFQDRSAGDLFPVVYAWNLTAEDVKAILGAELTTTQPFNGTFADRLFTNLRIEYQGINGAWPVIGGSGVKASDALTARALSLAKSDGSKGVHVEVTAYLANVSASNSGPQLVRSSGSNSLLVVPDGAVDGAISGAMWLLQTSSSTSDNSGGSSTPTPTNTNTDTSTNSGSSGGGGCEALNASILTLLALFILKHK